MINDNTNKDKIAKINYVKNLYNLQSVKVEKEQYIKELLLDDYVRAIKSYVTRYDLIDDILKEASKQITATLKKDRVQFETVKHFIRDDFLEGNNNFKITGILQCGYECYGWNIEFKLDGKTLSIIIPVKKNINAKNIRYAHYGMFNLAIKTSNSCWTNIESSYDIADIKNAISKCVSNNV